MSSLALTQTRLSQYSVLFTATAAADTTIYWYIDGNLVETSVRNFLQVELRPDRTIQVEARDDTEDPAPAYPDYALFGVDVVDDAATYRFDKWDGVDTWDADKTIDVIGKTYVEYETDALANGEHTYRVVPIKSDGTEGTAREFTIYMVHAPATPASSNAYDSGTTIITNTAA